MDGLFHLGQLLGGALGGNGLVEIGHDHGSHIHAVAPVLVKALAVGNGLDGVLKVNGPVDAGGDE